MDAGRLKQKGAAARSTYQEGVTVVDSRFAENWRPRPRSSAGQVIQMLDVSRSQAGAAEELKAPRRALAKPGAGSVSRAGTGVGTVAPPVTVVGAQGVSNANCLMSGCHAGQGWETDNSMGPNCISCHYDGFPAHGNFRKLLFEHDSPAAILHTILTPGFSLYDQWEAQVLALVLMKADVGLFSTISAEEVKRAHLEPVADIRARLYEQLERIGHGAPVAVMPEGPMTIPYLMPED